MDFEFIQHNNEKIVKNKQIALLDMDYFFAQCEIIRNPLLKNKPLVIVVPTVRGSGAVATCNYEARQLKIKSGMAISLAKKLSNDETIFLDVDKQYYKEVSFKVFEIIDFFCESVEQASIDEAYLDLTNPEGFEKAEKTCFDIKKRIKNDLELTCSIGLSYNKFLAKMAASEKKPDGFTKILFEKKDSFLLGKKITTLPGLGPNAEKILKKQNVEKIGELKKLPKQELIKLFGNSRGLMFYNFSRGIDNRIVNQNREKQQISRMLTLRKDSNEFDEVSKNIDFLCEVVFKEIKKINKSFKTCSIIIITNKFETITKSKTFENELLLEDFKETSKLLLKEFLKDSNVLIRRLGVRVSNFSVDHGFQRKLLDF
jgi:DNA polymerase IV (archaeal DinB-like DNA polymerase)